MKRRFVAAVAGVVLGLGAVTACTGSDESSDGGTASGDPGAPVATMNADGLPADYPRDQAPLVTGGEVTSVEAHGAKSYDVTMLVDGAPAEVVPKAVDLLTGAGWTVQTGTSDPAEAAQVLRDGKGLAIITNSAKEDQTSLSYTIKLP
ncbi:hypothetical protein [Nocardioides mangrovi]|uniref:Uncharacterized protein n=1 Tax=Nocardioides mangrovi TaxID=2874580 RepID=A0ABS7UC00_9ACTN|nr:hypothetical protein [Nocardioides mangrovi]MBZ5738528.1 hypothetical protein [Nocardioides mangrovi]